MRRALLLLALLARAAPRPPSLIVLRAACAHDPAAFMFHLPGAQLLPYRDTCGSLWRESVARAAFAALGAGSRVACAGWPGAATCEALAGAGRALAAPLPAACVRTRARAAALAWLAARLRWQRARLLPARGDECGAALRRAGQALASSGVTLDDKENLRPHVILLCAQSLPPNPRPSTPVLVLLVVSNSNSKSVELTDDAFQISNITLDLDNPSSNDLLIIKERDFSEFNVSVDQLYAVNKSTTSISKVMQSNIERVLMLSDEGLNSASSDSPEQMAQRAMDLLDRASLARTDLAEDSFHLYERNQGAWLHIATFNTSSTRPLSSSAVWSHIVGVYNSSNDFDQWCQERAAEGGRLHSVWEPGAAWGAGGAATALLAAALGARVLCRRARGRRRRADVVLAVQHFEFPPDERRCVGEGMETMLSCWLQQLHEFGGPELERPDLLKQPPAPCSTPSVNKLVPESRTRYKGDAVQLKYLPAAPSIELKRKSTDVLLVLQSLRHENLNPFIGCLCEMRPALVYDSCGRGSLEDVLKADDIKLDWTFRLSLLTDLVKGLRYLHGSSLRVHGRLSSRNCAVDSRWVLRLTDHGADAFRCAQGLPAPRRAPRALLWSAPELLRAARAAPTAPAVPTQPGDIFSFAIIMQEVIVRGEPYCMLALTPEEIVEKLCHPPPLIRPSVSMGAAPPEAVSVMRQCWAEAPDLRPDCHALLDTFRLLHRGKKINIVDSMFEMLEKYSNNLEELIKERTEELDMEKRKTEQLLNRMLPRSVAERLLLGSRVEPEEFEEVSIYFSDIVGFTALAARSTPVQVVDLLNDLYTTFDAAIEQYRVYKVETIGDAYMVVGGLPARARDHAESVATMALHLLHLAGAFRVRHLPGQPLHLRIGLHSGPCCAGVVGLTMPRYCLFGDTVNTASRMESTGAAWRIQVSAATASRLAAAGGYRLRSRGLTQIKGKGVMHTYWLLGKDGFDKPLPTPPPVDFEGCDSSTALVEAEGETENETGPGPPADDAESADGDVAGGGASGGDADARGWRRSGAVSADSSPPGSGRERLRRQWSLERGEAPPSGPPAAARARYRTRPDAPAPRY